MGNSLVYCFWTTCTFASDSVCISHNWLRTESCCGHCEHSVRGVAKNLFVFFRGGGIKVFFLGGGGLKVMKSRSDVIFTA